MAHIGPLEVLGIGLIGPLELLLIGLVVSIVVIDDLLKRVSQPSGKCPTCGRPLKYHRGH